MTSDRLLDGLLDAGVDFVIIGGVAAVLHGSTFLTRDLDICIPLGSEKVLHVQRALQGLNPRVRAGADLVPLALDASQAALIKNLYITTNEGRLDCLGFVQGVGDYEAVLRESVEVRLGRFICRVMSLDSLIRSKEALGRPHDLQTVTQLKALKERGSGGTR